MMRRKLQIRFEKGAVDLSQVVVRILVFPRISLFAMTLLLGGNALSQSPSPTPLSNIVQELRAVNFGETIRRVGSPNAVHGYQLTMDAGTSVECNVGEREIPFKMSVVIPETDFPVPGDKVPETVEVGGIWASNGGVVEPLVIVADKTRKYVIRVTFFPSSAAGKYSINCGTAHPTTERDRNYAAAEKLFSEIRQAIDSRAPIPSFRNKFEERAALYRELGDKKGLALAVNDIGRVCWEFDDYDNALLNFREALAIFEALNGTSDVFRNLSYLVGVEWDRGDFQASIDYQNQWLRLSRSIGSKTEEAGALFMLGVSYHKIADESNARSYYEQSFAINRALDPPTFDSLLAQVYYFTNMSNLVRGMDGGEIPVDAFAPRTIGDYQKSLEYLQQSLEINKKMRAMFGQNAELYTFNLLQIANTYKELGQYSQALEYLDRFAADTPSTSKRQRARVAILLGSVYARKREMGKASEYFNEVIGLLREGANDGNQIGYLHNIARDYYDAGYIDLALGTLQESLALSKERTALADVADSLFGIARIERDRGNFNTARKNVEEAIQIAESIRSGITADELRTIYFSTVKRYYDFYVDLLMQAHKSQPEKGFDALALQTSEKTRSRSLLDLLTRSTVDIRQGIDPALLGREKAIRKRLSDAANRQSRLLLAKHTLEEAAKLEQEVSDITAEFTGIQADIRNKSPRYAALTQPAPLDTKQMQQLLDSGTILLEYSLGEKKSFLWAVTPTSITSFDLPGRDEIETTARQAYASMTERNRRIKDETDEQRRLRIKRADAGLPKVGAKLSEMLLGPAADLILNKRLLIVTDGALNYIPFSALPVPGSRERKTVAAAPLGLYHEVVMLPSVSTLARLREETASRKSANKLVAIFADPVFNSSDSRVSAERKGSRVVTDSESQNLARTRDFEQAVSDVGLAATENGGLPRLPFSRREADAIFSASPKGLSLKVVDFIASKEQVFDSNLDQYRILHFATHGLINSQHPELSGVVLSLVDKKGGGIDGFLRLQDIYNLKLNADLVVLSACNTALGKEVRGEGLIGITRGFMYAGAPRVIASLWKVDDAATAELMSIFYKKMLVENLRPAAALRAAQAAMMKQPRWRSPYYWAPFVLQGEWK